MRLAPHPFTLRQLQYAIAVADELSFRRAAERCHVSQPALSAQLQQLEQVLGVQLFERDRRRVLVTSAGQPILDRARTLLLGADDVLDSSRRAADPLTGSLRIGVIPTLSPYLLPAVTPTLRTAFPRLAIAWREDKTAVLVRALEAGELDAALVAMEAELGNVESETLLEDAFVLAMAADHPLAKRSGPVGPADLRGLEVLLLDEGHCFREQALDVCSTARAREGEFRATSLSTLVQMVAGGAGVTLLPELSVPTEAKRANLRTRPIDSPAAHRTVALIWRKRAPLGDALRQLAGAMREAVPRPPRRRR